MTGQEGSLGLETSQKNTSRYRQNDHKNVGSVRFELTIDGSLRHVQRPLEPVAIPGLATTPSILYIVNVMRYKRCAGKDQKSYISTNTD